MGQARKKYTQEYKDEAVELVISSGRPIAEIARDLGIYEGTLGNWVHAAKKSGELKESPLDTDERAELRELREENRLTGMAADTAALIEHLGLGLCDVIGYSLGGYIAQELAVTRADLVPAARAPGRSRPSAGLRGGTRPGRRRPRPRP